MTSDQNSILLDTLHLRQADHARNPKLDSLIAELRSLLEPLQEKITKEQGCLPQWPVCLILGNPRSGTTLLLQWLASLGCFSYPTNLFTRFAYAPYIGILLQKMLFDEQYNYHNDFCDLKPHLGFSSSLGKSKGALAPNECFHFWRRFMPNFDLQWLSESQIGQVDFRTMALELGLIEKKSGKPFCAKGLMHQYNLPAFFRNCPFFFMLHVKRESMHVMQSILASRLEFYGTNEIWWSVKPKEYTQLEEMDVYHQIAGQVYFTEKAIKGGLEMIPETNQLTIRYESFCSEPKAVYQQIVEKYAVLGCELPVAYTGMESFKPSNRISLPKKDIEGFQSAYEDFFSGSVVCND